MTSRKTIFENTAHNLVHKLKSALDSFPEFPVHLRLETISKLADACAHPDVKTALGSQYHDVVLRPINSALLREAEIRCAVARAVPVLSEKGLLIEQPSEDYGPIKLERLFAKEGSYSEILIALAKVGKLDLDKSLVDAYGASVPTGVSTSLREVLSQWPKNHDLITEIEEVLPGSDKTENYDSALAVLNAALET